MELVHLESTTALRAAADHWDGLWRRSDVALPTVRASLLAQWLEQFAPDRRFIAVAVRHAGRLLGALPLIETRLAGCLPTGQMATCAWSSSGELLVDSTADVDDVLDCLVAGLASLPWPLLWLDFVRTEARRWVAFRAALARAGLLCDCRTRFQIGQIATDTDWETYFSGRSPGHRKSIRKSERRLRARGRPEFRVFRDVPPGAVEELLVRGFQVEDRSWKGRVGTSVLRSTGILGFFADQARQLAEWGQLELLFLELNGQPIAFEYGCRAKGVYFSHKVGYDEAYAALGPGQLLLRHQVERCHADPQRQLVDCMGVLCPATARWITHSVPVGRLVVGVDGAAGRLLVRSYAALQSALAPIKRAGLVMVRRGPTPGRCADRPANRQ